ncbi:unnamed protein product, partial [Ectocarpus sp. 12 AP-2014]
DNRVGATIPETALSEGTTLSLVMSDVRRVAEGLSLLVETQGLSEGDVAALSSDLGGVRKQLGDVGVALGSNVEPAVFDAAQKYRALAKTGTNLMWVFVLVAALAGFAISYAVTNKDFRARNTVERGILMVLIAAASIAILTTLGIVMSMLFETRNFFGDHPWQDFFFGLNWAPDFRGNSELAILPLLWGTLYISLIALLVAVPIGLFAAIYLSEYATNRVRSIAKPMIEILAGIPTIVYGLFALITIGPLLRDYFAMPLGLGQSASSVMTAGLVMGVMLIPFVSSLSDDIINAVPQSL